MTLMVQVFFGFIIVITQIVNKWRPMLKYLLTSLLVLLKHSLEPIGNTEEPVYSDCTQQTTPIKLTE